MICQPSCARLAFAALAARLGRYGLLGGLLGGALVLSSWVSPATAETVANSGCYVEDDDGQVYDLAMLCGTSTSPVLGTGDVQVTLRWATSDDLDLLVMDPAGELVSYFNPTAASGGELDVDANGFCEQAMATPVENIFWPTGSAPAGEYRAYVMLSIPCETTAVVAYEVPYTLTVLNQGTTETIEGVAILGADTTPVPHTFMR